MRRAEPRRAKRPHLGQMPQVPRRHPRKSRPAPPRVSWLPEPKRLHPGSRVLVHGVCSDAAPEVFAAWWTS